MALSAWSLPQETQNLSLRPGNAKAGSHILQHMQEYLRLKKFKTDEPVIDISRFRN